MIEGTAMAPWNGSNEVIMTKGLKRAHASSNVGTATDLQGEHSHLAPDMLFYKHYVSYC